MERAQDGMEKKVSLAWLLDFYGELLTGNQRDVARLYLEEDFTLAEIAQQLSVSRQSVHDTVQRTAQQLEAYESKLGLCARFQKMQESLRACADLLSRVQPGQDTGNDLADAREILHALLEEEGM